MLTRATPYWTCRAFNYHCPAWYHLTMYMITMLRLISLFTFSLPVAETAVSETIPDRLTPSIWETWIWIQSARGIDPYDPTRLWGLWRIYTSCIWVSVTVLWQSRGEGAGRWQMSVWQNERGQKWECLVLDKWKAACWLFMIFLLYPARL